MEQLLPSEIARLILGFLKENKCEKSWNIFLEECSDLYEYKLLYKRGKFYSTNVCGKSLLDILKEYCVIKNKSETISSKAKFSENMYTEEYKVILEKSIKNVVEQVIQQYLPCFSNVARMDHTYKHDLEKNMECENETETMDQRKNTDILKGNASSGNPDCCKSRVQLKSCDCNSSTEEFISKISRKSHHRCDLHTDVTKMDPICDHILNKNIECENVSEKIDQRTNTIILNENVFNGNSPDSQKSRVQVKSTDCNCNSSTEEFISKNSSKLSNIDPNSQTVKHNECDRIYMHDIIKVEKNSETCTFLEHKTEDHDSNREIDKSSSTGSESVMPLLSTKNNSVVVESRDSLVTTTNNQRDSSVKSCEPTQTNDCSFGELIQTIKVEPDSSVNSINQIEESDSSQNNNIATHVGNQNIMTETSDKAFCRIQSTRGSVNVANSINLVSSQPGYTIHPFASQSLPVPNMSNPSVQTYFVQNCPSNSLFLNNNSQYSLIIKTPATGAATTFPLTIPGILPNNIGPTLTSVTSLSNLKQSSVSPVSNPSSNINVADSTNILVQSETETTSVLNSVCKGAEALIIAPTKTQRNAALKCNLLARASSQKTEPFSRKRVKISSNKRKL